MNEAQRYDHLENAYEGLEDPESFTDADAVARYRHALDERSAPQVDFLARHVPPAARVLEIGCGNGRVLIGLARRRAICSGLGVDIARSRIAFAKQWSAELGCNSLEFVVGDALAHPFTSDEFAGAFVLTGAFGYFEPLAAGTAAALLHRLHDALKPGGLLSLEIYPHPAYRRLLEFTGGKVRIWSELQSDDPWRFYLSELSLDETGEVLTHEKTFVHRTSGQIDAGRRERLYLYTEETITNVLTAAGFRDVRVCDGWEDEAYRGGEVMVVLSRAGGAVAARSSPT